MSTSSLVDFLVSQPTATAKLLAQHLDDSYGRCRVCTVGGQHGNVPWPCTLYSSAVVAMEFIRAEKSGM